MPRILASNPAKFAEVNASIRSFQDAHRTRSAHVRADRVGCAIRLPVRRRDEGANGRIRKRSIQSGGDGRRRKSRFERQISRREVPGTKRSTFSRSMKAFDCWVCLTFRIGELAASPLDNNVLALGDLNGVHAAIDASSFAQTSQCRTDRTRQSRSKRDHRLRQQHLRTVDSQSRHRQRADRDRFEHAATGLRLSRFH